jgi:hypothetical protein
MIAALTDAEMLSVTPTRAIINACGFISAINAGRGWIAMQPIAPSSSHC